MEPRELLKTIYLFRDASPDDLAAIAAIAEEKSYMLGETIYSSGDISDALFVIEMGTVDVTLKGKDIAVASVGSGQALGEMAFFERSQRLASAVTRESTKALRVPYDKLDRVLSGRPDLALAFYKRACGLLAKELRVIAPDLSRRYF